MIGRETQPPTPRYHFPTAWPMWDSKRSSHHEKMAAPEERETPEAKEEGHARKTTSETKEEAAQPEPEIPQARSLVNSSQGRKAPNAEATR